jgi:hypothetical protein
MSSHYRLRLLIIALERFALERFTGKIEINFNLGGITDVKKSVTLQLAEPT